MSTESQNPKHTYNRQHIPSGRLYVGEFNASHDPLFAHSGYVAPKTIDKIKLDLIADWNWQQPTEWKYWL